MYSEYALLLWIGPQTRGCMPNLIKKDGVRSTLRAVSSLIQYAPLFFIYLKVSYNSVVFAIFEKKNYKRDC